MCCCGCALWLQVMAEERAELDSQQSLSSCQGLALASASLPVAKKLVNPKAKPWSDDRMGGWARAMLALFMP